MEKKALLVYEDPRSLLSEVCFIFPMCISMLESHIYTYTNLSHKRITPQHAADLRSLSGYIVITKLVSACVELKGRF